jgi:hypothetical protein
LRGEAAEIYLRWERDLKPGGFHLAERVLDFPGGFPGDIGLPGAVIRPVPGEWHPRMPERRDEEDLSYRSSPVSSAVGLRGR